MCLIVHRPAGSEIPGEYIENAMDNNPHGWGLMYADGGKIHVQKGFLAAKLADALSVLGKRELFLHFRWATHGPKNEDNCHPFVVADGQYAVMHNGMIAGMPSAANDPHSDTWYWSNRVLAPIVSRNPGAFDDDLLLSSLEYMVGQSNKIAILRSDGKSRFLNRDCGVEDPETGLWLSNAHSVEPTRYVYTQGVAMANYYDHLWRKPNYRGSTTSATGNHLWNTRDDEYDDVLLDEDGEPIEEEDIDAIVEAEHQAADAADRAAVRRKENESKVFGLDALAEMDKKLLVYTLNQYPDACADSIHAWFGAKQGTLPLQLQFAN